MTIPSPDRRRFHRIATDKPATLKVGERECAGQVLDISLRGLLVACADSALLPTCGARASARVQLDDDADYCISMAGRVMHIDGHHIGLQCTEVDIESATRLRRLVELNLADENLLERELTELVNAQSG
jgi:hypothetical protein